MTSFEPPMPHPCVVFVDAPSPTVGRRFPYPTIRFMVCHMVIHFMLQSMPTPARMIRGRNVDSFTHQLQAPPVVPCQICTMHMQTSPVHPANPASSASSSNVPPQQETPDCQCDFFHEEDVHAAQTVLHVFQLDGPTHTVTLSASHGICVSHTVSQAIAVPLNQLEILHQVPIRPADIPRGQHAVIAQRTGDIEYNQNYKLILIDINYYHHPAHTGHLSRPDPSAPCSTSTRAGSQRRPPPHRSCLALLYVSFCCMYSSVGWTPLASHWTKHPSVSTTDPMPSSMSSHLRDSTLTLKPLHRPLTVMHPHTLMSFRISLKRHLTRMIPCLCKWLCKPSCSHQHLPMSNSRRERYRCLHRPCRTHC